MSKSIKNQTETGDESKTGEKASRKKTSRGKTPKQIMSRHIKDKNDVITDEEFKNLELDLDKPGSTETSHTPTIPDDDDRPKDEDKDHKIKTPWDVLGE